MNAFSGDFTLCGRFILLHYLTNITSAPTCFAHLPDVLNNPSVYAPDVIRERKINEHVVWEHPWVHSPAELVSDFLLPS